MNRQTFTLSGEVGYASPALKTLAFHSEGVLCQSGSLNSGWEKIGNDYEPETEWE